MVFCSGCMELDKNSPELYPFTKWQSKDGSVTMYIDDNTTGFVRTGMNGKVFGQ